ncbi:MAG: hypothetical protein SFY66_09255 [Oculatellaceae cyanobacterium bins.114]|nr:hypothetical protein [Oculatellaceae cyanobacterium bins.114]
MRGGWFFSLGDGKAGQFLSPRVLVMRSPFRQHHPMRHPNEFCCFGLIPFGTPNVLSRALSSLGLRFEVRLGQLLPGCPYEVILWGNTDLAQTLAFWDRRDRHPVCLSLEVPLAQLKFASRGSDLPPAIAA